jgi:hypothetical protein
MSGNYTELYIFDYQVFKPNKSIYLVGILSVVKANESISMDVSQTHLHKSGVGWVDRKMGL